LNIHIQEKKLKQLPPLARGTVGPGKRVKATCAFINPTAHFVGDNTQQRWARKSCTETQGVASLHHGNHLTA